MATSVTLQLNADHVAGDWATRPAGRARTQTGAIRATRRDEVNVVLAELRGVVESIRRGAYGPVIAETRTSVAEVGYGAPMMYHGMRFAIIRG